MPVQIRRVWEYYDYTVQPRRFKYANVVVTDATGREHILITFDAWMASLCLQYEKKSSTLERQPPAVEMTWTAKNKILELHEVAA